LKLLHAIGEAETRQTKKEKAMKQALKTLGIIMLLAIAAGCASTTTQKTDLLSAAGFKLLPADTPKKQELLATLTPNKLTLIVWKGKQYYVQPASNNQAYVGTPAENQAYLQLRLAQQMSNDNLMAAQLNQDSMYRWGNAWVPASMAASMEEAVSDNSRSGTASDLGMRGGRF